MLSGVKPMAMFTAEADMNPGGVGDACFAPHVAAGRFVMHIARHEELLLETRLYSLPGEKWRGAVTSWCRRVNWLAPQFRVLTHDDWARLDGFLLGYSIASTEAWLNRQAAQRRSGGFVLKVATITDGGVIVPTLGRHAGAEPRDLPEAASSWSGATQRFHGAEHLMNCGPELLLRGDRQMAVLSGAPTSCDAYARWLENGSLTRFTLAGADNARPLTLICPPQAEWRAKLAIWLRVAPRYGVAPNELAPSEWRKLDLSLLGLSRDEVRQMVVADNA